MATQSTFFSKNFPTISISLLLFSMILFDVLGGMGVGIDPVVSFGTGMALCFILAIGSMAIIWKKGLDKDNNLQKFFLAIVGLVFVIAWVSYRLFLNPGYMV